MQEHLLFSSFFSGCQGSYFPFFPEKSHYFNILDMKLLEVFFPEKVIFFSNSVPFSLKNGSVTLVLWYLIVSVCIL